MPSDGTPRFLISRMSAVGDTVLTLPLLCALRAAFPHAYIAWVVEQGAAPMLQDHECLDDLIVLPRLWARNPARVWQLRQRLHSLRIDTAIDPQSINKSAFACWLSGAPRRIGLGGQYGRELSTWFHNELVDYQREHIVDRTLEMVESLGCPKVGVEFQVPYRPGVEARVVQALARQGIRERFALVNPGASWDSKLWPPERYAEVCRFLHDTHHLPTLVVWGNERELSWAQQITLAAPGAATLAPPTDLLELTELLRLGCLFVGSDTGPLHIAAAVGTPCVGMYGATRLADCGPYGGQHLALQVAYQAGSRKERRRAANTAMRLIGVPQVLKACDQILRRSSPSRLSRNHVA